jgi:chromosome segregation ATPase
LMYVLVAVVGFLMGVVATYLPVSATKRRMEQELVKSRAMTTYKMREHLAASERLSEQATAEQREADAARSAAAEWRTQLAESIRRLEEERTSHEQAVAQLKEQQRACVEIEMENDALRREVERLDVVVNKQRMDTEAVASRQAEIEARANEMAERYLAETEKAVASAISAKNYAACKQRLVRAIEWCRGVGFEVPAAKEEALLAALKADFEAELKK